MARGLQAFLGRAKTAVFEKGRMIYRLNIPFFRRDQRQAEALMRTRGNQRKIRVGFMLQVPNNFAVIEPVYDAVCRDPGMEPVVLLMPELTFALYVKITRVDWEKTYSFGHEKCGEHCVETWNPKTQTWLDPAELQLDYVFIPRPYETYLPKMYRASALRRLCRVCFVPYSSPLLEDWHLMYNTHFIRNVSLLFCEKEASAAYVREKIGPTVRSGDQKVFNSGFPKFDGVVSGEGLESDAWPRPREKSGFRVLWTPRWTLDPKLGGSSFLKYREEMIRWAEEDADVDLLFRPHPLALETYVREGILTREEEERYLLRYEQCGNAAVDRKSTYYDTMWSSDALITDVSSMLMDYMFTGRPILYCPTPAGNTTSEDPRMAIASMLEGMYIVHDMSEIHGTVAELRAGQDPKKEIRARLAAEMRRSGHIGADIVGLLKEDFQSVTSGA